MCYVKNDGITSFAGTLVISSVDTVSGVTTVMKQENLELAEGAGVTQFFTLSGYGSLPANRTVLTAVCKNAAGSEVSSNVILMTTPQQMALAKANVSFSVSDTANEDGTVDIDVSADKVALYVHFTTKAQGRFSDNSFLLPGAKPFVVKFLPFGGPADIPTLKASLRVEHLAAYM